MKRLYGLIIIVILLIMAATDAAQAGAIFDAVKQKGFLTCGISDGIPGFSQVDDEGNFTGIDVDFCRAVAAALFGDASKVKFIPLTAKDRFSALQAGEIDILSRNTTWTLSNDTIGRHFAGIIYYDGQGFLVNKRLGVKSVKELDGAAVCMQTGTTTEINVSNYFRAHDMQFTPIAYDKAEESAAALEAGRCDVLTGDQSQLYAWRNKLSKPEEFVVLPEVISKEPLGPVVRHGDAQWFDIVKWVLFAMLNAEELGVTSSNVEEQKASNNTDIRRLLGVQGNTGKNVGLPKDWAANIIKQVGNYGEVFERNLGQDSPLKIERGLNALWTQGGLQYAPPHR
jgi:general L-amino acid transport system substrate-binding protein